MSYGEFTADATAEVISEIQKAKRDANRAMKSISFDITTTYFARAVFSTSGGQVA